MRKTAARGVVRRSLPDCSPRPTWPGTHTAVRIAQCCGRYPGRETALNRSNGPSLQRGKWASGSGREADDGDADARLPLEPSDDEACAGTARLVRKGRNENDRTQAVLGAHLVDGRDERELALAGR